MNKNRQWRSRQNQDPYYKQAIREGWRSRAVYKLEQIDKKTKILFPDMICLDLGAAPGSWSQYIESKLKQRVEIIAIDILPMDSLSSVTFLQGDFTEEDTYKELLDIAKNKDIDLVMSDMAPNISGIKVSDQAKSIYLAELAFEVSKDLLKNNGNFVCKLFQGEGIEKFVNDVRKVFKKVKLFKPKASRQDSAEIYLIAKSFIS